MRFANEFIEFWHFNIQNAEFADLIRWLSQRLSDWATSFVKLYSIRHKIE